MKPQIVDPIFEELQKLLRRRDELDRAIAALERIRVPGLHLRRRMSRGSAEAFDDAVGHDLNLSAMTLASGIVTVLEAAGRPLSNAEIVDALIRGGLRFRGTNPPLAVAQALSRMLQKPDAICKLGRGRWTIPAAVQNAPTIVDPAHHPHEIARAVA